MAALKDVVAWTRDLAMVLAAVPGGWFLRSMATAAVVLVGSLATFYVVERFCAGDLSRYRTRHFWNDVAYAFFYRGGLYQLLIGGVVTAALAPRVEFLQLRIFHGWSVPAAAVAFWITADFLGYWLHRLQHANRFLWAFHRVHHAQEHLTFLTTYRIHPVEQLLGSLVVFVPLTIIGPPPETWFPLVASLTALEFAQHAELPWRFGGLYRLIVSPVFHALHHSTDRQHRDRNFGKILGVWDHLFGTLTIAERPRTFGVDGPAVPESLWGQLVSPLAVFRNTSSAASTGQAPSSRDAVVRLLQSTHSTMLSELNGSSMGTTLQHGSTLRIDFQEGEPLRVGDVIAFHAGPQLVAHRIVGRGRFGPARDYLVTQGDGSLLIDHPVRADHALGVVREWKDGDVWKPVPAFEPRGWQRVVRRALLALVMIALHVHRSVAMAVTVSAATLHFAARTTLLRTGRR